LIIDTTYLLPLAKIGVDTDLLRVVAEGKTTLEMDEFAVSLISLFELQAKAVRLGIPASAVNESIQSIVESFTLVSFSEPRVVDLSFELRREIDDYVDCIIVATAAAKREGLVTEDSRIWKKRRLIFERYGVQVSRYRDVLGSAKR
jgi:predicted nucleic acid-binding protein